MFVAAQKGNSVILLTEQTQIFFVLIASYFISKIIVVLDLQRNSYLIKFWYRRRRYGPHYGIGVKYVYI